MIKRRHVAQAAKTQVRTVVVAVLILMFCLAIAPH